MFELHLPEGRIVAAIPARDGTAAFDVKCPACGCSAYLRQPADPMGKRVPVQTLEPGQSLPFACPQAEDVCTFVASATVQAFDPASSKADGQARRLFAGELRHQLEQSHGDTDRQLKLIEQLGQLGFTVRAVSEGETVTLELRDIGRPAAPAPSAEVSS